MATVTRSLNGMFYLSNPRHFNTLVALRSHLIAKGGDVVANEQDGEPPKLSRCTFIAPDVSDFATEYSRVIDRVRLTPTMAPMLPQFRRWSWVAADSTGTKYKPDEATGLVLACAMGVYHATLSATMTPFTSKGKTI